jgi:ribonuclease PH
MRPDGRRPDELRAIRITPDCNRYAEGSALVEFGETKVICTATVENKLPPFLVGLIGRALRAAVRTAHLGERQLTVDCDVIQADGGTRTAAITGGWVALALAVRRLVKSEKLAHDPLRRAVAALSVGMVAGEPRLDLAYEEDSAADVDFNFVMTDAGQFIEIQGTAEGEPFSSDDYAKLVALASVGAKQLFALQRKALEAAKLP